jgi:hypothetical protein
MGGSRKSAPAPEPKPVVDPMLEFLKQQQIQQKQQIIDNSAAERQALMQSQNQLGSQAEIQGEQAARQALATTGSMQSIRDANALSGFQTAASTAGQQATGGGFDVNSAQQNALANMGYSGSMLPKTAANMPYGGQYNPTNTFSLPNSSDLKFGGV